MSTATIQPRIISTDMPRATIAQRVVEPVSHETDEQIVDRLRTRFTILEDMTKAVKKGDVRAMIVSGPPGVGKTTVAQLIGQALKRKTGLINLAGENDTIKLKGSRRTYVDSQPSNYLKKIFINTNT